MARRNRIRRYPGPLAKYVPLWYVCEVMGCSNSQIYNWRKRGIWPASAFIGTGTGTRMLRSFIEDTGAHAPDSIAKGIA